MILIMIRKTVLFCLATSILSSAKLSNAFVPRPNEDLLSNLADKYGEPMVERKNEPMYSGKLEFLRISTKWMKNKYVMLRRQ